MGGAAQPPPGPLPIAAPPHYAVFANPGRGELVALNPASDGDRRDANSGRDGLEGERTRFRPSRSGLRAFCSGRPEVERWLGNVVRVAGEPLGGGLRP